MLVWGFLVGKISCMINLAVNLKCQCIRRYVCGWKGRSSGGGRGCFQAQCQLRMQNNRLNFTAFWCLKISSLWVYSCTILWCQLRLYTTVVSSNSRSYLLAVVSNKNMMMKHFLLLQLWGEARGLRDSQHTLLPAVPGTAGLPIFSVPPAPLSKINGAGGRWMKVQWVQI